MTGIAIGIDLGTTNSCASYFYNGRVKILENSDGGRITPSFLFVTERNAIVVGHYAKCMAEAKPENGVYEVKRLVSQKFDDPQVQKNLKYFSFKVVGNDSNDPVVEIDNQNTTLKKTPQELSTVILAKIKKNIEAKLGQTVDKAVITVLAYFNMNQREVTLAAAKQAGFTVLKLLNEPTAAALSYYLENDCKTGSHALVYDLGGGTHGRIQGWKNVWLRPWTGTFDVAVLKRKLNNIEIVSVDGDTHLGGQDLNDLILDYVCEELKKRYDYEANKERRTMQRLQNICEEAKKNLSVPEVEETTITLTNFFKPNEVIEILLTRKHFESMADEFFKKTLVIVENCLKSSNLAKSDIKEVILSGGSTRVPKIQSMLTDFFNGKNLNKFVNPDECVAEGGAIQAALLSANPKQKINAIQIIDVIPLSLGVRDFVNVMGFLIKRNTPIPAEVSCSRVTVYNLQESIEFEIYEGERMDAKKNRYLGKVELSNITPASPGQCKATLTISIDLNGILTITAKEIYRNNVKDLKIDYTRGQRSDSEVKNALKDAKDNQQEDYRFKDFAECKRYVLSYCIKAIYNFEKKDLVGTLKDAYELCKEIKIKAESMNVEDETKLKLLKKELKRRCDSIVQRYNFEYMPYEAYE